MYFYSLKIFKNILINFRFVYSSTVIVSVWLVNFGQVTCPENWQASSKVGNILNREIIVCSIVIRQRNIFKKQWLGRAQDSRAKGALLSKLTE